jgi:hypothetical protein
MASHALSLSLSLISEVSALEVLLSLSLLVHGVEDGLPLCVVPAAQVVDLAFHVLVEVRHPVRQLVVRQVLKLRRQNGKLYLKFWGIRYFEKLTNSRSPSNSDFWNLAALLSAALPPLLLGPAAGVAGPPPTGCPPAICSNCLCSAWFAA